MTEQDQLVAGWRDLINEMIVQRQGLDDFLASGKCSTFRGNEMARISDKMGELNEEADVVLQLIEELENV